MKKIDSAELVDKRYSSLTIVSSFRSDDNKRLLINVVCDCGNTKVVDWDNLRSGKTKSCGCKQHREKWEGSGHQLLRIWTGIKQRCYNPNCDSYPFYGAKGITICDEWKNDYPAFYKWCIENGWEPGLEVDKDLKGGRVYSPTTCSIVTHKQNMSIQIGNIRVSEEVQEIALRTTISGRKLEKIINVSRNTISKIRNRIN